MTAAAATALAVLLLDQVTKYWALQRLLPGISRPVLDSLFSLTLVMNPGLAFGMLGGMPGGMPGVTPIATPQPAQFGKALDLLKTLLGPGADGKPLGLGQVNGALGQTIGNLLNGKKTALGLLGAVGTPILSKVSETAALGPLLGALTPAIGLSGFALPVFLGLTAWGVLGKMEKWSQGTAPRPRA